VVEAKVARLRVKGSRYFLPSSIKERARSMAEGKVVNFNQVTRDIVALNQLPDRQITPELRAGAEPGTVEIDLNVKDTLPLHGSIELNNRYSPDTPELRLNGSLSYNNLWQLGHSVGASFQIAPEDPEAVRVFSGYYIARLPNVEWLSLMVQGVKQESNVNTLGSIGVVGKGEVLGFRAIVTLPPLTTFYHSVSFGFDYKRFDQQVNLGTGVVSETPITYWPLTASYDATWAPKGSVTTLNAGVTAHLRGTGSDEQEFENSRFKADGAFIYLRGELAHTRDLPGKLEGHVKVQGQIADRPLVSSEQYTGGGLGTVRGYLEAEAVGDSGVFGTVELRSPSLLGWVGKGNEWRIYGFAEGGFLTLREPLPEQESRFELASVGVGSRLQLWNHLNASVDAGMPLISQRESRSGEFLLTFRVWADF
jgi:hemolysin activation/secretion protein